MFIHRSNGGDCQSSLSCSPSDNQPAQPDSHSSDATYDGPGPQRYIGVGMVAAIVVLALVLWVWFGAWPKQMLSKRWWSRRKRRRDTENIKANGLIDLTASLPSLEKPKRVRIRDNESDIPEALEPTDELAASKRAVEESGPKYGFGT
ncbi:hypothetical protein JOM56_006110 [Amanita muscaria]